MRHLSCPKVDARVVVEAAGCMLSSKVFFSAAEEDSSEICQWRRERDPPIIDSFSELAAQAAARSGHLAIVRWLLQQERSPYKRMSAVARAWLEACYAGHQAVCEGLLEDGVPRDPGMCLAAAARGGHVGLTHWLLQQFEPAEGTESSFEMLWKADVIAGAAYSFDLAALQQLHRTLLQYDDGDDVLLTGDVLIKALSSPTPDWRAKVEWLQAQGCRLSGVEGLNWEAVASRSDAVDRVQVVLLMGDEVEAAVPDILNAAVCAGNLPLVRYLRAERDWVLECEDDAIDGAARVGNMAILVEMLALGWVLDGSTALAAAMGGQLHILEWLEGPEAAQAGGGEAIEDAMGWGWELLDCAISSDSVEVMEWLLRQRDLPWSGREIFKAAAARGSPALLEWLAARGFSMGVAVKAAGCMLSSDVFYAAAEAGNLEMYQWLQQPDRYFTYPFSELAAQAAARSGHLVMVRWLLQQERNRRSRERAGSRSFEVACYAGHQAVCEGLLEDDVQRDPGMCLAAAARGGHVGLTHWLLQQFEPAEGPESLFTKRLKDDLIEGAAYGFDLAALQQVHQILLQYDDGDDVLLTVNTLPEALSSPTPDWRAKVEWLQAHGCRLSGDEYMDWRAIASRSDAVDRVELLLPAFDQNEVVPEILRDAAHAANLPLVRYLRALRGMDWLPGHTGDATEEAARVGNMTLLVEMVTLGWQLDDQAVMAAAAGGQLHILEWLEGPEAAQAGSREAIQAAIDWGWEHVGGAISSDSVEVMEWLLRQRDLPWSGREMFKAAAARGSPALLEWLAARGFSMGDDGEPYVTAANHHDLVTLRCLRRLGWPWGPDVFSQAVYDKNSGSTLEILQWLHAEGCPVDWEAARSRAKTRRLQCGRGEEAVAIEDWIESIAPK
ncbi:hypothetical protein VOLCADRAFT_93798 [Volvox carteri f. nagariensis]|uniref:Ankyrin repeat domain-containing protein n=1 Tax=Volvox carteri f. nagariensis TaxID=3068 RepID=D8U333_VOLCA|nr:uncharacterized protein VOLCADRAFT_93798 [Volvox carteri f. nagariensis]EFJ45910.1 hypothetical protein VOLCADRAFT_93798 [Volvox carteri f. nagariensis]|eukprot:XP_002952988.1 hypothetical protein VOLCADRAFT_93798 [Volvox carteri f. nagariensis]